MALREARGNFESPCTTPEVSKDIIWWGDNILDVIASSYPTLQVDLTIFTDASNEGWGASINDQTINGRWNESEKFLHIKFLCHGVVVITTAQLHSTKSELRFYTGSNPACSVSEICDGENLWQWSWLEIRRKCLLLVNHTTKTFHLHQMR